MKYSSAEIKCYASKKLCDKTIKSTFIDFLLGTYPQNKKKFLQGILGGCFCKGSTPSFASSMKRIWAN